jgi:hypothetical protein
MWNSVGQVCVVRTSDDACLRRLYCILAGVVFFEIVGLGRAESPRNSYQVIGKYAKPGDGEGPEEKVVLRHLSPSAMQLFEIAFR